MRTKLFLACLTLGILATESPACGPFRGLRDRLAGRVSPAQSCATATAFRPTTFTPVYDDGIEENKRFCKATPNGTITMTIDNPVAQQFYVLGETYYFDSTAA